MDKKYIIREETIDTFLNLINNTVDICSDANLTRKEFALRVKEAVEFSRKKIKEFSEQEG